MASPFVRKLVVIIVLLHSWTVSVLANNLIDYRSPVRAAFKALRANKNDKAIEEFKEIKENLRSENEEDSVLAVKRIMSVVNFGLGDAYLKKSQTCEGAIRERYISKAKVAHEASCSDGFIMSCDRINNRRYTYDEAYYGALDIMVKNGDLLDLYIYESEEDIEPNFSNTKWEEVSGSSVWYFKDNGNIEITTRYTTTSATEFKVNKYIGIWEKNNGNNVSVIFSNNKDKWSRECSYKGSVTLKKQIKLVGDCGEATQHIYLNPISTSGVAGNKHYGRKRVTSPNIRNKKR